MGVSLTLVLISGTMIAITMGLGEYRSAISGTVRFVLTCVLAYFLLRGAFWSRLVAIVLTTAAGLLSVVSALGTSSTGGGRIILLVLGATYLGCAALLLFPRSVKQFFEDAFG